MITRIRLINIVRINLFTYLIITFLICNITKVRWKIELLPLFFFEKPTDTYTYILFRTKKSHF